MSKSKILISVCLLLLIGMGVLFLLSYYDKESGESTINIETAEEATASNETEEKIVRKPGTVVYQIPGMEKVELVKDIVYKADKDVEQKLNVYYPLESGFKNKPYPVILIHGRTSDKNFKDSEYFDSWGRLVAAYGFAAVTFNWRSGTVPEDISDLLVYVKEHTEELGIDGKGIGIIAFSAGVENGVQKVLSAGTGVIDSIVSYYGKLPLSVLENNQGKELPAVFIAEAGLENYFPPDCNDEFVSKAAGV